MVDDLKIEDVNEKFRKMETYNKSLGKLFSKMSDPFVQDDEISTEPLNFINKDEIFGTISIPKINEELPIYLGASQENLSKGVGQIEGLLYRLAERYTCCIGRTSWISRSNDVSSSGSVK